MKKRILLSSFLVIALCSSLIAGSTFALFTDSTEANVAVTAGKVDVEATLSGLRTYSMGEETAVAGSFANGGTAEFTTEKALVLDKVTPGDKVTFNVMIENNSNVSSSYRIKMTVLGGLAGGLVGRAGEGYANTIPYTTTWADLPIGEEITLPVSIELPKEAGNEYQDKSATVVITVEAVQGNAEGVAWIGDTYYESLEDAMAVAQDGDVIRLGYGDYALPDLQNRSLTFRGYGDGTVIDCTRAQNMSGTTLHFEEVAIKGINQNYIGYQHAAEVTYTDCTVYNRITLYADSVAFRGCTFMLSGDYIWTYGSDTVLFEDCDFIGANGKAILIYQESDTEVCNVTVEGCRFTAYAKAYTSSGEWTAAIEIDSSLAPASVTVNNSVVNEQYSALVRLKKGDSLSTPITVDGSAILFIDDNAGLKNAITDAASGSEILLPSGNFSLPTMASKDGVTIIGTGDTVIGGDTAATGFGGNFGKNSTFKNLRFEGTDNGVRYSYAKGGVTVFENCTFSGESVYGFHIDGAGDAT
ncbi:MAG: right-handed parallel beta-helix repeat-containing protein, partial [Clostridia bacterium]|nr:right-handed parallel beta-helix repeat-containing protein [Clostridia bacterium]